MLEGNLGATRSGGSSPRGWWTGDVQLELEEPTAPEVPAVKLEEVLDSEFLSQLLPQQFCTMQKLQYEERVCTALFTHRKSTA